MEEYTEMVISEEENNNQRISTLVFMDLEATGLPSFMGKKNVQITEMSFIAIDRQNFEEDCTFRVLNKLSLCIRPRSIISPGAMQITGLYNDVLEKQERFDESIPKLLEYFFRRLQKPLCLLAHNGRRYDFPLFQAELKNINYTLDSQILCADTLEAFRYMVSNPNMQMINTPVEKDENCFDQKIIQEASVENGTKDTDEQESDSEIEILLTQDIHLFKDIKEPSTEFKCHTNSKILFQAERKNLLADEYTPPKCKSFDFVPKSVPRKKTKPDPTCLPKMQYENGILTNSRQVHAKRQLFADKTVANNENKVNLNFPKSKPTNFSLEKLYHHYFGESPPTSHYAEADCIALSKVCQKVSKHFLKWIDDNSTPFSDTVAMW